MTVFLQISKKVSPSLNRQFFWGSHMTFMLARHWPSGKCLEPAACPAAEDKVFCRKRHRVVVVKASCTYPLWEIRCRGHHFPTKASFCTMLENIVQQWGWPCSSTGFSPHQAPVGCLWQVLLHRHSLRGVQEKKKVSYFTFPVTLALSFSSFP